MLIKLSINEGAPLKCLATGVRGRHIDVSLMQEWTPGSLEDGRFAQNARASLVFRSEAHGDSPAIGGIVREAALSETGGTLSIEILDWDLLAKFWRDAEEH